MKNLSNALNGNPTRYRYYDPKKQAVVSGVIGAAGAALSAIASHNAKKRMNSYNRKWLAEAIANDEQARKAYSSIKGTKYERKVRKRGV